jgi:hypothetical protein
MTIKDGVTVEDTGDFFDDDTTLLNMFFGTNSMFQLDAGGDVGNMTLAGNPSGEFKLAGGTTTFAAKSNYQYIIGADIYVAAGATLTDMSKATLKFTNTNLTIDVLGTMNVQYGTGAANTLLDATGFSNDYIDVTADGTLNYLGSGGVADTFKNMPVFLDDGNFIVTTATGAPNNGRLIVTGTVPNQANNASVYVTGGDGTSTVQLSNGSTSRIPPAGTTLVCDNGYYQDSGTLETMDATTCQLQASNAALNEGTVTIAGSSVKIDQPNVGYGQLNILASTLNFGGQLVVAIDASNPDGPNNPGGTADVLKVNGATNLQAGSTLTVFVNNGPPNPKQKWVIINAAPVQPGNFVMPITTVPQTNLGDMVNPDNNNQYIVTS